MATNKRVQAAEEAVFQAREAEAKARREGAEAIEHIRAAYDAVMGAGAYDALASELYESLRGGKR